MQQSKQVRVAEARVEVGEVIRNAQILSSFEGWAEGLADKWRVEEKEHQG